MNIIKTNISILGFYFCLLLRYTDEKALYGAIELGYKTHAVRLAAQIYLVDPFCRIGNW